MFRLLKQNRSAWIQVGELDFLNGSSTVQKSLLSNESCLVINSEYCLSGESQDLKQLKNHIDVVLGNTFESQVNNLASTFGYGRVMDEASDQWKAKASSEGRPGEGMLVGPHSGSTVDCGCDPEDNCKWCCGSGWLTKHVKSLKNDDWK